MKNKSSSKKVKLTKSSSTRKFQFYKNLLEMSHLFFKLLNTITDLFK